VAAAAAAAAAAAVAALFLAGVCCADGGLVVRLVFVEAVEGKNLGGCVAVGGEIGMGVWTALL
jgi:hypothetical protein